MNEHDVDVGYLDVIGGFPWLAVYGAAPERLIGLFGFQDPLTIHWPQAAELLNEDDWDDHSLARVFVTPRLSGWVFVVGYWVAEALSADRAGDGPTARLYDGVTEHCRVLSSLYGKAAAFGVNGQDWHFWILAAVGEIRRRFVWGRKPIVDEGVPVAAELASRREFAASDLYDPSSDDPEGSFHGIFGESIVDAVATEWSLSPSHVKAHLDRKPGLLLLTSWGKQAGYPNLRSS